MNAILDDKKPSKQPLNGSKTHPLSDHCKGVLARLEKGGPLPHQEINPGAKNRLYREDLVEEIELPSPYKSHKGSLIPHAAITERGRAVLEAR